MSPSANTGSVGQTLGARIAAARGELSQADVAERLGVSRRTLQRWEHGVNEPTVSTVCRLAATLGCDLQWLLTGRASCEDG